jgi:CRISPR/Cas system type I-B associated protein Csh2 (Cas7 group RAMP superfamily)
MQATPDEYDELLDCRMAMLGLNLDATNGDTFNEIMRRCKSCGYRETCAVDLKRDPNNPVWETYCPVFVLRRNHTYYSGGLLGFLKLAF